MIIFFIFFLFNLLQFPTTSQTPLLLCFILTAVTAMAVTRTTLPLLLLLSFFSPVVFSRIHVSPAERTTMTTTTTLDVSAALAMTSEVITYHSNNKQQSLLHQQEGSPSSDFSLSLHSRDSLRRQTHKDYKSLTLSRLRRDAARVEALTARLNLAVNGIRRSDLKPLLIDDQTESENGGGVMRGSVMSGISQGSGEYFFRVSIGEPPKPMYMVLDTGSDITWIQCKPCAECYQQTDPIFDPKASASYSPLSCDSTQCRSLDVSACRNSTCLYQVAYGDGSYTVGNFGTETVTFGDSGSSVNNVAFGCGHANEGLFVGAAGILGLGGGELSFPSQVSATDFSYCLVDRDSTSTSTIEFALNGAGLSSSDAVTAPLLRNQKMDTYHYVGVTGMSVGGQMLSIPSSAFEMDDTGHGGVIIDSGTAVTRLHPDAYSALRDAFKAGTTDLPAAAGVVLFDTCYDLASMSTVEVPTVAFHFPEGKVLRLSAKNYIIPVDSNGIFCLAFASASSSSRLSIIGNVQQQGTRVSFDLSNGRVGFSPNKC